MSNNHTFTFVRGVSRINIEVDASLSIAEALSEVATTFDANFNYEEAHRRGELFLTINGETRRLDPASTTIDIETESAVNLSRAVVDSKHDNG